MKEGTQNPYFVCLMLLGLAWLFVSLASYSTSPLYPYCFGSDSAQFQTIGKAWAASVLPYQGLFDHKGPLIFLMNALGYALSGSKYGVYFLQVIFFAMTLHGLFLLASSVVQERRWRIPYAFVLSLLFCIFLGEAYDGGNLTEEYCLPFLMYSTYFQLQYILERPLTHQKSHAALYGLTFAVCLLTRLTNAVALLCGMACIFFNLLGHKQYKNILENTAGFLLGLALPVLLFALYFYRNDALFDCCYGTLLYNLEYQKHMVSWLTNLSSSKLYDFILSFFPVYAVLFVLYTAIKRHNILLLIFSLLIFFSECYLFLSGALYPHYAVAVFPQFVIIINEAVRFFRIQSFNKSFLQQWKIFLLLIFMAVGYLNAQDFAYRIARNYIKYNNPACIEYAHMGEFLKENFQGKALVVYGGENCKSFYLHYDFLPCYKYFVLQEWHARFSPRLREDIRKVFSERKAYAIVVSGQDETIRDILTADYELVARDGDFRLYRIIAKTL